jgi:putative peptidoglycan lipid II flippase
VVPNIVFTLIAGPVLAMVLAAASMLVPAGGSRLVWLVVAILAGELAAAGMVLTRLRQLIRPEPFLHPRALGGALLATVAMVPVTAAVRWIQHAQGGGQLSTLAVLTLGGIAALGVYALVLRTTLARGSGAPS